MDISEKYKTITVQIDYLNHFGSGCVYFNTAQSEKKYVFTAKHIFGELEDDFKNIKVSDIKIILYNNEKVIPVAFLYHSKYDLAVIEIKSELEFPLILLANPYYHMEIALTGYPAFTGQFQKLEGKISYYLNKTLEMSVPSIQNTFGHHTKEIMDAFSGGGIYFEDGNDITLVGIYNGLKAEDGAYHELVGTRISELLACGITLCINESASKTTAVFEKTIDQEDFNFFEKDIKEVILFFSKEQDKIVDYIDINYDPDLERKNSLNNLSNRYFQNIKENHLLYFGKIASFLKDSRNKEYLVMYQNTCADLKNKIITFRDSFETFDKIFNFIYDYILHKNITSIKTNRTLIWVFLHYMYWECDIGERPNDKTS